MKEINPLDPTAIILRYEGLSPATLRAQRLAELEQMAKFRARRMEIYKSWAKDPEKTREKLDGDRQKAGDLIVKQMGERLEANPDYLKFEYKPAMDQIKMKEIYKHPPKKKSLWRYFKEFIHVLFDVE